MPTLSTFDKYTKQIEETYFFTPAGLKYNLDMPPVRFILSEEGFGMPPINYVSQRGPYQHGETLRDYFLGPRIMQLIVRHNYCNRSDYWTGRKGLIDVLRPNIPNSIGCVPGQGTLRRILPDGTKRDITCIISQGPNFAPDQSNTWDQWSYTETLRFTAFNPIWFDPNLHTVLFDLSTVGLNLIFPITFPILFGSQGTLSTSINYAGDWNSYPLIKVTGPLSYISILNTTTNQLIYINFVLPTGRFYVISLSYGNKSVTLDDGTNIIAAVTPSSNLAQWQLVPGVNNLVITVGGNGVGTSVTFTYSDNYIGI